MTVESDMYVGRLNLIFLQILLLTLFIRMGINVLKLLFEKVGKISLQEFCTIVVNEKHKYASLDTKLTLEVDKARNELAKIESDTHEDKFARFTNSISELKDSCHAIKTRMANYVLTLSGPSLEVDELFDLIDCNLKSHVSHYF